MPTGAVGNVTAEFALDRNGTSTVVDPSASAAVLARNRVRFCGPSADAVQDAAAALLPAHGLLLRDVFALIDDMNASATVHGACIRLTATTDENDVITFDITTDGALAVWLRTNAPVASHDTWNTASFTVALAAYERASLLVSDLALAMAKTTRYADLTHGSAALQVQIEKLPLESHVFDVTLTCDTGTETITLTHKQLVAVSNVLAAFARAWCIIKYLFDLQCHAVEHELALVPVAGDKRKRAEPEAEPSNDSAAQPPEKRHKAGAAAEEEEAME